MISREKFIEILNLIKEKRSQWNKLQDSMEELSPGEYVNFWPYFQYEDIIIDLLNEQFDFASTWSPISYFVTEGDFGKSEMDNLKHYCVDDIEGNISSVSKLYSYCKLLKEKLK